MDAHIMDSLDLKEAAQFLKIHPEELRRRARAGLVPGAKIGKRWVFIEDDLVYFLRSQYAVFRQARQVASRKESSCHFISAEILGGSSALRQTGDEYKNLLGLSTKSSRKNTATIAK
jgi:hypothetical protein